jgi:hypothetical protein
MGSRALGFLQDVCIIRQTVSCMLLLSHDKKERIDAKSTKWLGPAIATKHANKHGAHSCVTASCTVQLKSCTI